jgi:hypothetical protein
MMRSHALPAVRMANLPPPLPVVLATLVALAGCDRQPERPKAPAPPRQGTIRVTSEPTGAAVLEEGRRLGKTPLSLTRPAFKRVEVDFVKDGYNTHRASALVEPGNEVRLHVVLKQLEGFVVVRTGLVRGARVTIDGEYRGRTPCKLPVTAGPEHTLEIVKDGMQPQRERVTVKPGEVRELIIALIPAGKRAPPMGRLTVVADTLAMVYLDNVPVGQAPLRRVPVPAGRHRLKVVNPATKAAKTVSVTVRADQENKVEVRLRR